MGKKLFLFVVLLLISSITFADEIKDSKILYENINRITQEKKSNKILCYVEDVKNNVWKRVKDADSKQKFNQSLIKNEVFIHNKKVIKIVEIIESKSGDWENLREFYFRKNGKVAFVFQKIVTFQAYDYIHQETLPPGPYILEKRKYYDLNGKEIKALLKAYISTTKNQISPDFVHEIDLDEYKSIQEFPSLQLFRSEVMY